VVEVAKEFEQYGAQVDIHDPWADPEHTRQEYGIDLLEELPAQDEYDAILLAVAHEQFRLLGVDGLRRLGRPDAVVYDIKGMYPKDAVDGRL
jgi:UDP-N-acetyl-D-galactosamine dehydrogenase